MEKKLEEYLGQVDLYCETLKEIKAKGKQEELLRSLDERFLDIECEYMCLL